MKHFYDLVPVILFFIAYKIYGFYVATVVVIIATIIQVGAYWYLTRELKKSQLLILAIVVLFGGMTLVFDDPTFFKWKPTVAYWLFAVGFLGSQFIGERSFTERMMSHVVTAPRAVWNRLNIAWALFFTAMGIINIYVAYNYSEDTWVNFKLFGIMGLTLAFIFGQGIFISQYLNKEETREES